jgi:Permease family
VIALTNVAARQAGFACAAWLFGFGLLGKVGGIILSIPHCVLGGGESAGMAQLRGAIIPAVRFKALGLRQKP